MVLKVFYKTKRSIFFTTDLTEEAIISSFNDDSKLFKVSSYQFIVKDTVKSFEFMSYEQYLCETQTNLRASELDNIKFTNDLNKAKENFKKQWGKGE